MIMMTADLFGNDAYHLFSPEKVKKYDLYEQNMMKVVYIVQLNENEIIL